VLLHLLWRARRLPRARLVLRALHVDHGLQPAAADFRRFCLRTARRWQVPLTVVKANVQLAKGDSVEQAARQARRAALAAALAPGELLLTAQHADDQLETLLLALLRGAGPAGLAAMPAAMPLGDARLLRPLLDCERAGLEAYAHAQKLAWIDDPTNQQPRFDRNYLRARVLPLLRSRWPALARTAGRSARHCAVAATALQLVAARDLALAADGADLEIAVLRRWSAARRAAVLRAWIQSAGARAPNERHVHQIEAMLAARVDAHPQLQLPDCTLRREGGRLRIAARQVSPRR
jgi:tRNA(Ile)-lysidine synthase